MKIERRAKILELIGKYQIETQEELGERLEIAGFPVTQATISRDIRELKLTKVTVDGVPQEIVCGDVEEFSQKDQFLDGSAANTALNRAD